MGQKAMPIGRKDCMEAMCHMCHSFNANGRTDCVRVTCPLFAYSPYASGEPAIPWASVMARSAIGLVPRKGVTAEDFAVAAETIAVYAYGSVGQAPPAIVDQVSAAHAAVAGDLGIAVGTAEPSTPDNVPETNDPEDEWGGEDQGW